MAASATLNIIAPRLSTDLCPRSRIRIRGSTLAHMNVTTTAKIVACSQSTCIDVSPIRRHDKRSNRRRELVARTHQEGRAGRQMFGYRDLILMTADHIMIAGDTVFCDGAWANADLTLMTPTVRQSRTCWATCQQLCEARAGHSSSCSNHGAQSSAFHAP